jgi:hypothetical protein
MRNVFYVYKSDKRFITIDNELEVGWVKSLDNANYWTDKQSALSWETKIKKSFPEAKLEICKLNLVD